RRALDPPVARRAGGYKGPGTRGVPKVKFRPRFQLNLMAEENKNPEAESPAQKYGAVPFEIPVLPLQNTTLFPDTMVPLAVGRPASIAAVEAALASEEKLLACVSVRPDKGSEQDAKAED